MAKLVHCQLYYKFDKASYLPGEVVIMNVWIKNMGDTYLYLSDIILNFDFGIYKFPKSVYRPIAPKKNEYLGVWRFQLPQVVGNRKCIMEYVIHEYVNRTWEPHYRWKKNPTILLIYPRPVYRLFLSRGIRPEDRKIGDHIASIIRQWGFYTVTVGIEVKVPDHQVAFEIRRQILMSDAVLVITTPRTHDVITQTWKTLEWIHAETGIAYGFNKPLLILKDSRVNIEGLPSYLRISNPRLELSFDVSNLGNLSEMFSLVMPSFRLSIQNKSSEELIRTLGKVVIGGFTVIGVTSVIKHFIGKISAF
jgi:hypothetical protein